ncbi:hypothetical protein QE152_g23025 [Popillia japonica]|uniref:Retrotransposon gag domain-containing protein n=1 Tax=Popillia japonica TaxID=7064 RepID=A0AAW1KIA6_POPJA
MTDLSKSIEPFEAEKGPSHAREWLHRFETTGQLHSWPQEIKYETARANLKGAARYWYKGLPLTTLAASSGVPYFICDNLLRVDFLPNRACLNLFDNCDDTTAARYGSFKQKNPNKDNARTTPNLSRRNSFDNRTSILRRSFRKNASRDSSNNSLDSKENPLRRFQQ